MLEIKRALSIFLGALSLAVGAGCNGDKVVLNGENDRLAAPLGTISVYQLAGRLDMAVVKNSRTMATLRDQANVVMIYGDPDGQAYINGKPVGRAGGITPVGDILFVPEGLSGAIRAGMRKRAAVPKHVSDRRTAEAPEGSLVVLDAGHGGHDPGAISVIGVREKAVVLDTALKVGESLRRKGVGVLLTRPSDKFLSLNERADIANRQRAALFVSIHADSCRNPQARGFTVYVARSASPSSLELADAIERQMSGLGIASRGIQRANFRVLVRTSCPAALIELGYLSNVAEASKLCQEEYRRRLAEAISEGLYRYLARR